jgi:hypothetical protein
MLNTGETKYITSYVNKTTWNKKYINKASLIKKVETLINSWHHL